MALLTRSGRTIGFLAITSYLAGWLLGWNELMICAAGCGLALVVAAGFVVGRHRVEVTRSLSVDRVTVGDPATSTLTITNPGRTPVGPRRVEERSGERSTSIDITGLGPGATKNIDLPLDTSRRGIFDVGPTIIVKSDPLGLMRREIDQAGVDRLWVQPRVVPVRPVPVGFAKDLEGPTSDSSPAGDVSFHTIREYAVGDDHRHVHWLSSARTGTLMVRHHVDNRRPVLTVLLDTDDTYEIAETAETGQAIDTFELAVEVVASLVVNTQLAQLPVSLHCGVPAERHEPPIDVLTRIAVDGAPLDVAVRRVLAHEPATSVLVLVTGARPAASLLAIVEEAKRSAHVIVVRCCAANDQQRPDRQGLDQHQLDQRQLDQQRLPGATTLMVDRLETFQVAWNAAL